MRFKIPMPLSSILREQRRWGKKLTAAMRTLPTFDAPKPARVKPARARASRSGLVEVHAFGHNPGRLRMLEFVPSTKAERSALVVVLHGCLQTAQGFDHASGWSRMAREKGFVLLYPEQTKQNNQNLCFNWFRPSAVARDRGELMSIRQMIEHSADRHGIAPDRIFVQGLSAGGAMTAALLSTYPDLFAAGQIVGGLPFGAARDAMTALSVMKSGANRNASEWGDLVRQVRPDTKAQPAVSIWHGSADHVVAPVNARASLAQWLDLYGLEEQHGVEVVTTTGKSHVWKDREGRVLVEFRMIDGLDHGLPITRRAGTTERQPYMLEGAISAPVQFYRSFIKPV
ncbi:esterase, PHB depolymerase family [Rhizobium sp. PDO1-076]|uniref:extracellular catalytic domain type 1 short-chain-length polyhydroxyalkanoate depolymerase n=1 Tax=Rhizobium sp. PDO1-076 TaxID=1125979 RepID=UPI00024E3A9B|nr:PHB depolymerase family esterase [Rhizobium sp. PDO1-076]EHS53317.1 esterase, PHB depolymerase family [Rhizobium sp. PDO1-076]